MAKVTVKTDVKINRAGVRALVTSAVKPAARRSANLTQKRVKTNIITAGRVDTREMLDKVVVRDTSLDVMRPRFSVVGEAKHTIYQEQGSRGSVPVKAKVLRFKPKGSSVFVFARRTKGFPPGNFFKKALAAIRRDDFL